MSTGAIRVERNPKWLDRTSHLALLNQGFPGYWGRAAYDWYIARPFHGIESDTLVVSDGHRALAAVTVCYRQVGTDTSGPIAVGVMSAGATLCSERGRGHYGRLLEAAREDARRKGYVALLGFVTRDNASGRGLLRRGATAIPSFYIVSAPGRGPRSHPARHAPAPRAPKRAAVDFDGFARRESSRIRGVRFLYERADDWQRQFIDRPDAVRVQRLTHDSLALIETVAGTDRLQWLASPREKVTANLSSVACTSVASGRQLFLYTLDPLIAAAARRVGLAIRHGYLMVWPTGYAADAGRWIADAAWTVQSGDRM